MIGLSRLRSFLRSERVSRVCFVSAITGIALLGTTLGGVAFGFVVNYTHSAPFGLYREIGRSSGTPQGGTVYAFFCPDNRWPSLKGQPNYRTPMRTCPDGYSPLIKPVIAWPGDEVQTSPDGISVNGRLLQNTVPIDRDSSGRHIFPYRFGVYKVQKGQLWVVSSFSPRSFDSRYFGPIPIQSVKTWLRPFWVENVHRGERSGK
jgi:conjugative transfer signal peptidase TraF